MWGWPRGRQECVTRNGGQDNTCTIFPGAPHPCYPVPLTRTLTVPSPRVCMCACVYTHVRVHRHALPPGCWRWKGCNYRAIANIKPTFFGLMFKALCVQTSRHLSMDWHPAAPFGALGCLPGPQPQMLMGARQVSGDEGSGLD